MTEGANSGTSTGQLVGRPDKDASLGRLDAGANGLPDPISDQFLLVVSSAGTENVRLRFVQHRNRAATILLLTGVLASLIQVMQESVGLPLRRIAIPSADISIVSLCY